MRARIAKCQQCRGPKPIYRHECGLCLECYKCAFPEEYAISQALDADRLARRQSSLIQRGHTSPLTVDFYGVPDDVRRKLQYKADVDKMAPALNWALQAIRESGFRIVPTEAAQ